MDLNTNNQNMGGGSQTPPQTPPAATPTPEKDDSGSTGAIVGSIIIIVIIILGGLYFLNQRTGTTPEDTGPTGDEIRLQQDNVTLDLANQSASDEISDIEADLNNTELEALDEELDNILNEL